MVAFGAFIEVQEFRHPITPIMSPGMNDFPVSSFMFVWIGIISCFTGIVSKYLLKNN